MYCTPLTVALLVCGSDSAESALVWASRIDCAVARVIPAMPYILQHSCCGFFRVLRSFFRVSRSRTFDFYKRQGFFPSRKLDQAEHRSCVVWDRRPLPEIVNGLDITPEQTGKFVVTKPNLDKSLVEFLLRHRIAMKSAALAFLFFGVTKF